MVDHVKTTDRGVDFGRAVEDYAAHRKGFPDAFFARLHRDGIGWPNQRVVDVGTGTGTLAHGFAQRGCQVIGLDPSEAMLEAARRHDTGARFTLARAEATGLDSEAFDVVTAGQCWHWFDRTAAAQEAFRLLVPGGRLVIAHLDWIPRPGNIVERSVEVIERIHPERAEPLTRIHNGSLYGAWFPELDAAGFGDHETFSFDIDLPYSLASWTGRLRASAAIGGTLSPDRVAVFSAALHGALADDFQDATAVGIPHRVFALITTRPGLAAGPHASAHTHPQIASLATVTPQQSTREGHQHTRRALAKAANGEALGCSHYVLEPGQRTWPYHYHLGNEEALFILSGRGSLRLGEQTIGVRAGDSVALPVGDRHAHQLINDSRRPLSYLCVSTMHQPDITVYPDSNKVGVFAGAAPGGDKQRRTVEGFFTRDAAVDYWLDES